jgi:hypothetical protein
VVNTPRKEDTEMQTRHKVVAATVLAIATAGIGAGIAAAHPSTNPVPQAPVVQGPDVPGQPDLPEPGDVPDAPGQ